jgi:hypothetical protein
MKTAKQIAKLMRRRECIEYSKDASRCYGQYYVSGNRARESGYEECKTRDTCPWYMYREKGWNDIYVTFACVKDFRRCNHKQLDKIKIDTRRVSRPSAGTSPANALFTNCPKKHHK